MEEPCKCRFYRAFYFPANDKQIYHINHFIIYFYQYDVLRETLITRII